MPSIVNGLNFQQLAQNLSSSDFQKLMDAYQQYQQSGNINAFSNFNNAMGANGINIGVDNGTLKALNLPANSGQNSFLPTSLGGWFDIGSNTLNALGGLWGAYNASKQYNLAKDAWNFQKDMAVRNYNNEANEHNARLYDMYRTRGWMEQQDTNAYNDEYNRRKTSLM